MPLALPVLPPRPLTRWKVEAPKALARRAASDAIILTVGQLGGFGGREKKSYIPAVILSAVITRR